jgi:hypothetical protein
MKWFKDIQTLDQLRTMYRKLAFLHHPDRGGSTADMQEINNEYEILSKRLIHSNTQFSEGRKSWEEFVSSEIRDKLNEIIFLEEIIIEIIGSWIWVTGNTRAVKDQLKLHGFKFSPNKLAWYWQTGDYRKLTKKQFSLDDLRIIYGSDEVETQHMKTQIA